MSYRTWIEYGYGIKIDNLKNITPQGIENLLSLTPKLKQKIYDFFEISAEDDDPITVDDLKEYDDTPYGIAGIGGVLCDVIATCEDLEFLHCEDYDGHQYLMFTPDYPWHFHGKYKDLREEDIKTIIRKYCAYLDNGDIDVDYYECENGG